MDDLQSQDGDGDRQADLGRTRTVRARRDDEAIEALDDRVEEVLALFGRAHAVEILRLFALEGGPWRFSELEARLGVSPHTLSSRLTELTEAGLLVRRSYDEVPPRVEYTWTRSALDLAPAFHSLYDWAREHELEPADHGSDYGVP